MMRLMKLAVAAFGSLGILTGSALAAGGGDVEIKHQHWHFSGLFGQYDKAAVLRGFQVFEQVCAACHGAEYFVFRNLTDLDLTDDQVKAIASNYQVPAELNEDGRSYNDDGQRITRPAIPSDNFPQPFENPVAAAAVHGKAPPDLSLIAKSRPQGPDYLYSLLTGYVDKAELSEEDLAKIGNNHYNKAYPGHVIAMAAPLRDEIVDYQDGTPMTASQYAKDVSEFLMWLAEPKLDQRKRMGWAVMIFMLAFTILAYLAYAQVKARVHTREPNGPWPLH